MKRVEPGIAAGLHSFSFMAKPFDSVFYEKYVIKRTFSDPNSGKNQLAA